MSEAVTAAFDAGAWRYDLLVGLNPGYHAHLDAAAHALAERTPLPARLVDLGCGSGASTAALLRACGPGVSLLGVDASAGMLGQARAKSWPAGVEFIQGRAGALAGVAGEPVAGILAAYLFRNVPATERDAALSDAFDALEPGGTLVVLEYSVAGDRRAATTWRAVCRGVILPLASLTGGNRALYEYLERSVLDFDTVPRFCDRLVTAGFTGVQHRTVPGWQRGILHLVRATKPDPGDGRHHRGQATGRLG